VIAETFFRVFSDQPFSDLARPQKLEWEVLSVDEGHRLKNKHSRLFQELRSFKWVVQPDRAACPVSTARSSACVVA
jgi:hypothetical protein